MNFEFLTSAYWKENILMVRNRMQLQRKCEKTGLKEFDVIVKSKSRNRSTQQNRYYFACVTIVANELGYSKEEMHSIIGYKFLKREKIDESSGEVFEYILSTSKLTTTEFSNFMEEFIRWSAEHLNIILPSPNEQLTIL